MWLTDLQETCLLLSSSISPFLPSTISFPQVPRGCKLRGRRRRLSDISRPQWDAVQEARVKTHQALKSQDASSLQDAGELKTFGAQGSRLASSIDPPSSRPRRKSQDSLQALKFKMLKRKTSVGYRVRRKTHRNTQDVFQDQDFANLQDQLQALKSQAAKFKILKRKSSVGCRPRKQDPPQAVFKTSSCQDSPQALKFTSSSVRPQWDTVHGARHVQVQAPGFSAAGTYSSWARRRVFVQDQRSAPFKAEDENGRTSGNANQDLSGILLKRFKFVKTHLKLVTSSFKTLQVLQNPSGRLLNTQDPPQGLQDRRQDSNLSRRLSRPRKPLKIRLKFVKTRVKIQVQEAFKFKTPQVLQDDFQIQDTQDLGTRRLKTTGGACTRLLGDLVSRYDIKTVGGSFARRLKTSGGARSRPLGDPVSRQDVKTVGGSFARRLKTAGGACLKTDHGGSPLKTLGDPASRQGPEDARRKTVVGGAM
ncbi:hypothetical protein FB451DRAFT_1186480 [Mycena latifolia]|nr:hypothetical protein FB451DRAFT_1186480 [Mycena latifolia]